MDLWDENEFIGKLGLIGLLLLLGARVGSSRAISKLSRIIEATDDSEG